MIELQTSAPPTAEKLLARPRIGLICDFVEENWPSMDLVAGMVFDHLGREQSSALEVTRICPPMRMRFGRIPAIGKAPALRNADRLLNRFLDYGRSLKPRIKEFDLFHLIDHSYSQLIHDLPAGRAVVTCHDLDTFRCVLEPARERRPRWFRNMAEHILSGFRKAAHVIAVSASTRDQIVQFGLHPANRVTVISNGVHPSCSATPNSQADSQLVRLLRGASPDGPWLLSIGNTMARKRLDLLLRVLSGVRKRAETRDPASNIRLLRVGEPLTPELRQLARQLGVDSSVIELGFLDRDLVAAAYRRATVLVHTAEAEGFGLPLVEAMACGCPVVASDVPVLREVGGTAATYCAVGDIDAWTCSVIAAIQVSSTFQDWKFQREKCFANAARFSWSENALRTAEVYRQVLGIA